MKTVLALLISMLLHSPAPAQVVRVLTWNIHHGVGGDGKLDLERIAKIITAQHPDVVFLQEVDNKCTRSGSVDQAAEIARLTGLNHVFGKAMDFDGGEYGQAILTNSPLANFKIHTLPSDQGEPRISASATMASKIGQITVATVHLAFENESRQLAQAQVCAAALLNSSLPVILAGDFNTTPESRTLSSFTQAPWSFVPKQEPAATSPADKPAANIDHVVIRGLQVAKPSVVIAEAIASDHRPVLAVVTLPK